MTLDELNGMDPQRASNVLNPCCGSERWADGMAARRPFNDSAELHRAADSVWSALGREDWLEAFASHPKIGDTQGASHWSKKEQEGVATASDDSRIRLARLNTRYQEQFGFIFIICATGKSSEDLLTSLEKRINNCPEDEIQAAGEEQMKIVHLRLNKVIDQ
jgi:OHCU decarboxylase